MTKDLRLNLLFMENIYKFYGHKLVLDNIDLSVSAGEVCSLVGPSGCGKSTLLRLILGQERPNFGEILIDGVPAGFPDPQRGIVYQKYPLYHHLSVLDNVLLGRKFSTRVWKRWKCYKELREEAMYYLEQVKLVEHCDKFPHELSGGMQQRVALAQALIMKPKILLMDEPFGALDPGVREHLQIFLLELWDKFKMTIFFVTHDLEEAVFVGTRILVLSQFYLDDRGNGEGIRRGSKIVFDESLPRRVASANIKDSPEFRDIISRIRQSGFDPKYLQHAKKFNLRHPDSFQTLTSEEAKD